MTDLINFLIKAKVNTYASQGEGGESILEDGCKELKFNQDNFRYRDRYFGSNPFIGEEIIWKNNKIIWGMNYYGAIISDKVSTKIVYGFLKKALKRASADMPFRGPEKFQQNGFRYINKVSGNMSFFYGEEKIYLKEKLIYKLKYHGGQM
jgi:hypothetical protein